METVRIGIIGVSGHAKQHLLAIDYLTENGMGVLAAAVIKPDAEYAEYADGFRAKGVRIYREYQEMFASERGKLDLIAIPTGIAFHEEHSVAALNAGFHVLCEKPVAGSAAEALRMKAAAERTGNMLAIGYQYITSPMIKRVKEYTMNGKLGRILSARTLAFGPRDAVYYTRNGWAGKMTFLGKTIYDSPMQNAFAHYLMNMLYTASPSPGKSARVTAVTMENYRAKDIEYADTQWMELSTSENVPVHFISSHACEKGENFTEYRYERGRIEWTPSRTTVYEKSGVGENVIETIDNGPVPIQTRVFIDAIEAIRNARPPACTIESAMQQTIAIEKGFISSDGVHTISTEHTFVSEVLKRPEGMKTDEAARYNAVIKDIEITMKNAFDSDKGFFASGLPWAKRSKTIAV
ncbi:MAG: Gfo/Idh/MocA family oxidoreductase [Spirochaetota bacterium]